MTVAGAAEDLFSSERARLLGLAYRILGSVVDAEDVVQEAWLRWSATDRDAIQRPAAWLTTVTTRLALDRLRWPTAGGRPMSAHGYRSRY